MKKIQLALDTTSLDLALEVLDQVKKHIDIVEVGTPLIKEHGALAISEIAKQCHNKPIIADMKTMDYGDLEVKIASEAGATGIIIQAAAALETLDLAYGDCQKIGLVCYIDSIGLNFKKFLKKIFAYGECIPILHLGVDEQRAGRDILTLAQKKDFRNLNKSFAIAGGISSVNAKEFAKLKYFDTFIIGGSIMKSEDPLRECSLIREILVNH